MTETPLANPAQPLAPYASFAGGGALILAVLVAVSVGAVSVPLSIVWGILADHLTPNLVTSDWTLGREAID